MTPEQQRADDTERVHRVDDRDHQQREMVTRAVQPVERTGYSGERHHRQKRERHHPERPPMTPATHHNSPHLHPARKEDTYPAITAWARAASASPTPTVSV